MKVKYYLISFLFLYSLQVVKAQEIDDNALYKNIEDTIKIDTLSGIFITGKKPSFKRENNKFIFTPNEAIKEGASITELFKQVPLLNYSESGEEATLSILGKENTQIFINGKRSLIKADVLLQMLSNEMADNIEKIEIITMPGASYDIQGNGGVVNIVLKKNNLEGANGNIRFVDRQNSLNTQKINANLSYKKYAFEINSSIWGNNDNRTYYIESKFNTLDNDYLQISKINIPLTSNAMGFSTNLNYDINKQQNIALNVDASMGNRNNTYDNPITWRNAKSSFIDSTYKMNSIDKNENKNLNTSLNYTLKIGNKGDELNVLLNYVYSYNKQAIENDMLKDFGQNNFLSQRRINQIVPQLIHIGYASINFKHIIDSTSILQIGSRAYISQIKNDADFFNWQNTAFINDTNQTNYFNYNEQIASFFIEYSKQWNEKWSLNIGIKAEHTQNSGSIEQQRDKSFKNSYWNFLPQASLDFSLSENHQFSYSYSNQVKRPTFGQLNPFKRITAPNTYIKNNPFLQTPLMNIHELSYTFFQKYTLMIGYNKTNNQYAQVQIYYPETKEIGVEMKNYGYKEQLYISFSAQLSLWKNKIESSFSGIFLHNYFKGSIPFYNIDKNGHAAFINVNNTIYLSKAKKWFLLMNIKS